ncbi:MAG: S-layer homology domain-containing protein [Desulfocucumaceae bacterium]
MLCFISTAYAALPDVSGHWAQMEIEKWAGKGLAKGYPDGTFRPDGNVTRAEFVTLMNRAFGKRQSDAKYSFADVSAADWYYADVCTAARLGYVRGYEDNTFKPANPISRTEAGVIVSKTLNLPAADEGVLGKFSDAGAISDWAKGSISALVEKKLISGYSDGSFKPGSYITRAESIVILDKALAYSGQDKRVPVTAVNLSMSSLNLSVGTTIQLTAIVEPENASDKVMKWSSSDEKIAAVDNDGKVSAIAQGTATITVTTEDGNKAATCEVKVTPHISSGGGGGGGGGGGSVIQSVSVSLSNTASGIGKMAAVSLTGYADVTAYRLLKSDNTVLTGKVNVGSTVLVLFIAPGDSCKVELFKADGTLLDTRTVNVTAAGGVNPSVSVSLSNTASGIGKVATVSLTGYTDVTSYRLLKSDTALTGKVNVGNTVLVLFLAPGDNCKVELYKTDGTLPDTKSVVVN